MEMLTGELRKLFESWIENSNYNVNLSESEFNICRYFNKLQINLKKAIIMEFLETRGCKIFTIEDDNFDYYPKVRPKLRFGKNFIVTETLWLEKGDAELKAIEWANEILNSKKYETKI